MWKIINFNINTKCELYNLNYMYMAIVVKQIYRYIVNQKKYNCNLLLLITNLNLLTCERIYNINVTGMYI